jgi:hypothetical protein
VVIILNNNGTELVKVIGIANEGISLKIYIDKSIDILDFIEEIGKYFYKIDNPMFGQKYISSEAKDCIYYWLIELFNTGNYEEFEDKETELVFNMLINFKKIGTFKYALDRYKKLLKKYESENESKHVICACTVAVDILQIIENTKENQ